MTQSLLKRPETAARIETKVEPCVLWFTGLSGAGKSTIAEQVKRVLEPMDRPVRVLDGDELRKGLCKGLGFSAADREENIRRIGAAAKKLVDQGFVVLAATISPFRTMRAQLREKFAAGQFIEVYVDTPLATCEERDPKGLYHKARAGLISEFTGIDSPYEAPLKADIHLLTDSMPPAICADWVVEYLRQRGYIK